MTALAADRNTGELHPHGHVISRPVAAGEIIYKGALCVTSATGFLEAASTATGNFGAGKAQDAVDNSAGSDGDVAVDVRQGIHIWANGTAADAVTLADVGLPAYAIDDQTVSDVSTGRSQVGKIVHYDSVNDEVWVQTDYGTTA